MTSLSVAVIPKIVTVIFLICLTRAAAGSCLSYGHSCWGGHGKRSTSLRHLLNPVSPEKRVNEWYYTTLMKFLREKPVESPTFSKESNFLEKLIKNDRSLTGPAEDLNLRNEERLNLPIDNGEVPEGNYVDFQNLNPLEENYLVWNTKQRPYQKLPEQIWR